MIILAKPFTFKITSSANYAIGGIVANPFDGNLLLYITAGHLVPADFQLFII